MGTDLKRIQEIITKYDESDWLNEAVKENTWDALYHISPMRADVIGWYPFQTGKKALEIGAGCGAITQLLIAKKLEVTAIESDAEKLEILKKRFNGGQIRPFHSLREIVTEDQFDYILVIGTMSDYLNAGESERQVLGDFFDFLKKHLSDSGVIFLAENNPIGLRYLAGAKPREGYAYYESVEGYPRGNAISYPKKELTDAIALGGLKVKKCYYPYPDYCFTNELFSDEVLPQEGGLIRNNQTFYDDRLITFDETKAFSQVVKAGAFSELSNSFLFLINK